MEIGKVPYKYADELKKHYDVFGSFYDLQENNQIIPCRNVLEIVPKGQNLAGINVASLYKEEPDAVFIMMNPGSSTPLPNTLALPTHQCTANLSTETLQYPIVTAKPDITQYMVMNVMEMKHWNRVRILNLSDFREPNSKIFFAKIVAFFNNHHNHLHSIFYPARRQELEMALGTKTKPIVVAWGQDRQLITLATLCKEGLSGYQCTGLFTDTKKLLCRHASPTLHKAKEMWLQDITSLLGKKYM